MGMCSCACSGWFLAYCLPEPSSTFSALGRPGVSEGALGGAVAWGPGCQRGAVWGLPRLGATNPRWPRGETSCTRAPGTQQSPSCEAEGEGKGVYRSRDILVPSSLFFFPKASTFFLGTPVFLSHRFCQGVRNEAQYHFSRASWNPRYRHLESGLPDCNLDEGLQPQWSKPIVFLVPSEEGNHIIYHLS